MIVAIGTYRFDDDDSQDDDDDDWNDDGHDQNGHPNSLVITEMNDHRENGPKI